MHESKKRKVDQNTQEAEFGSNGTSYSRGVLVSVELEEMVSGL